MNRCGYCEEPIRYDEQRQEWTTDSTYDHTTAEESADMARQCGLAPDSRHFPVSCSANTGGDPASGCDELVEGNDTECPKHFDASLVEVEVVINTSICEDMHVTEQRMVRPVIRGDGAVEGFVGSSADFCDVCENSDMTSLGLTVRKIRTTPEMAECYRIRYDTTTQEN